MLARRDADNRVTNRERLLASSLSSRPSVNAAILDEITAIRPRLLSSHQAAATGRQQAATPAVQEDSPSIDLPAAVSGSGLHAAVFCCLPWYA